MGVDRDLQSIECPQEMFELSHCIPDQYNRIFVGGPFGLAISLGQWKHCSE
jgi:hypothetical protein